MGVDILWILMLDAQNLDSANISNRGTIQPHMHSALLAQGHSWLYKYPMTPPSSYEVEK